ncbi:hypothetical protein J2X69_002236 [Algoriphagus sp. 4150]|uniref:family 16 glycoside hydrolase n=1 Tax=Algoriphagus sp. 4150 TaxID=2817756 RepID=UPI00285484BC|nr:family 16 glycoside hydrolase [Algoriphagus sp. 4150]MDR7129890.1 hypothetical protein [Algoriphagus sp. 4150]
MKNTIISFVLVTLAQVAFAQEFTPNLHDSNLWYVQNREPSKTTTNGIELNAEEGDGMMVLKDFDFKNGSIELDVKGEDKQGASFVGLAFNIQSEYEYETLYFRPFNFQNEARKSHAVQYTYNPDYTWDVLREKFPAKYENSLEPAPDPNDWFHVRITKLNGKISVYVNNQSDPCLVVSSLSKKKNGMIGLWVGNGSKGEFKNLKIVL